MSKHHAPADRFKRDVEYYQAHREELLEKYPEHWVTIFSERVVGADRDVDRLLAALRARAIPTEKAFVERVTAEDELLILLA